MGEDEDEANSDAGTGIFRTPALVYHYTQSVPISLAWWTLGAVMAIAGILVYMELGLTLPLYQFGDRLVSVPRSGGELNYLKYIIRKPAFFTTCVFGIAFILLGNVSTNSMAFASAVLEASGNTNINNYDAVVRGVALAAAASTCIIHSTWRQGGIYLNNLLAIVKIMMLLVIFIIGMCCLGGVFERPEGAKDNFRPGSAVNKAGNADAYGYAEAFLAILFAFGGLNQANYVMGEVDDPRCRYKWPAFTAVVTVSVLYIMVNCAYFIVVPAALLERNTNIAQVMFELTIGTLGGSSFSQASTTISAFMAVSSYGNIIVMTYTAARVKQEIAKEGVIPLRRFLAGSIRSFTIPFRRLWCSTLETLPEDVPFGALILHFTVSAILILATWPLSATTTYGLLVDLYSYTIDAVFGTCLGFGLLYMRFFSKRNWAAHSRESGFAIPAWVSCTAAFIFGIANLYPVAAKWVPPSDHISIIPGVPWYTTGVVGTGVLVVGGVWWAGFRVLVPRVGRGHKGRYLLVTRKLCFLEEGGYKVLDFEDVDFRWVFKAGGEENGDRDGVWGGPVKKSGLKGLFNGDLFRERTVMGSEGEAERRRERLDHRDMYPHEPVTRQEQGWSSGFGRQAGNWT
jgi:amino acid transporter